MLHPNTLTVFLSTAALAAALPLAVPAARAGFSGCIGYTPDFRCCSPDHAPGGTRFAWLSIETTFGRSCATRGGSLKSSTVACGLGNKDPGRTVEPVRIECVAPEPEKPAGPPRFHDVFPSPAGGLIEDSMLEISSRGHYAFGARTYLDYGFMGTGPNYWTGNYLDIAAHEDIVLQLGLEPYVRSGAAEISELRRLGMFPIEFNVHRRGPEAIEFTLIQTRDALEGRGTLPTTGSDARVILRNQLYNRLYVGMASWAKTLAAHPYAVVLRPLSEMNEGAARWQLSNSKSRALESSVGQVAKRADAYARIWALLREIFREAGATNVRFLFAPLSHTGNYKDGNREPVRATLEALRRIPASQVDVIGLNVYATAYSTPKQLQDHTFEKLSGGWIHWLRAVPGMEAKPLAIGEMGIGRTNSSTGVPNSEADRIQWIREAYSSSKKMGFSLSTYFNRDKWACAQESCRKVLGDSIRSFQEP